MKIPANFLDANGKPAKGEVILVRDDGDEATMEELGTVHEHNEISCYVIASPGEILKVRFALNAGIADQADLVVDGILRSSIQNKSSKGFKGAFDRALYKDQKPNGRRGATKFCSMRVKERSTANGKIPLHHLCKNINNHLDLTLTNGETASSVGSFAILLYRRNLHTNNEASSSGKEPSTSPNPPFDENKVIAKRAPNFDKFAAWSDFNRNINHEGPPLPFEIE